MALELGSIGRWLLSAALLVSPLMLLVFRPRAMPGNLPRNILRMARDYWAGILVFLGIYLLKNYVDVLNDPIRGVFGDFTFLLFNLEGAVVLHLQNWFEHGALTALLNANYLFAYVFMTYFGFILFAYMDDRELANKMALNVFIIYVVAIPFYVFFNVQVTSDYIPGMKALLYNGSGQYLEFFTANDPLDNAFPSLHIGIPFGFFLLMYWTARERGATVWDWTYRRYLWFVVVEILIFAFSILYLGIHWVLDIPGGLLIGLLGAVIVQEVHEPWYRWLENGRRWLWNNARQAARSIANWVGHRRT